MTATKRKPFPTRVVLSVYVRDQGVCGICALPVAVEDASMDHITPRSLGGSDDMDNLRLSHLLCNIQRGNGLPRVTYADAPPYDGGAMNRRSLSDLREERGWSMRELARRAEVSPSQLHHWEAGDRTPRADTLRRVAAALGVSMDDIVLPGEDQT